ncbi:hypothetical protein PCYB_134360 [Plasmodium cynomolgi strain B]|uniref:Uncharacterized protein n=1 Tax=Plasmodium cynomolgi (strain B) TaxID=1120755 RepID=K6VGV5_PLACD|nr:hypothetical protein PCYB_134360 [Plasmodium cynomolgi strain B]GAB68562.1 hypothetical protein PCYB_134360 [Plasmodium cynomolgi strain B]
MDASKKKNKNSLESLDKEDVETLIRKCYRDKLVYGYTESPIGGNKTKALRVKRRIRQTDESGKTTNQANRRFVKWKEFDRKDFKQRHSVNTFKNIWRMIKRRFESYKKEYHAVIQDAAREAKEIIAENKERKKNEQLNGYLKGHLNGLVPLSSKVSLSNISLLRNFTRVNSLMFKTCSNYYSPLNSSKQGSPQNFIFPNKKKTSKDNEREPPKGIIDYIKRNIKDIQRRSEFLDLYFLVISLIHQNKKYALLKKMEELYYQNRVIKCCSNSNQTHNNKILIFVKKILEISLESSSSLKSICTKKSLEKKFGSSKYIDSKNCITVEIDEVTYPFSKNFINYKTFYNLCKRNLHLSCNKVISFFIPLPKKPNHLIFKNGLFHYFDTPITTHSKLDDDVYNYVYVMQKYFLSFKFWHFYLTYQGIEKMKKLFNREVDELNSFFDLNYTKKDTLIIRGKKQFPNFTKKKNVHNFLLLFDHNIQHLISLSLYVIKLYLKMRKKRDLTYIRIVKMLNLSLHPVEKKKVMRFYSSHLRFIHSVLLKLGSRLPRRLPR